MHARLCSLQPMIITKTLLMGAGGRARKECLGDTSQRGNWWNVMDATVSQNQACKAKEEEKNVMCIMCTVLKRHMML